ncbi:muramoyltetrapeptide carboxypeptidase [Nonlabens sp. Hel1_33_55]|uniref:S66 peptidase family protein n=1 Tax=Nonlabens sp. Hel1_33_55 TaxID=1336802 RepID=UPI000875E8D8|nr:LD-carboxypeptidase [Nonlabens sp. Hel1_33_55]SCY31416.1 muramoyltetrapeptide carboxypeptidase [Nonlabens sp. Hel1_33_55]
MKEYQSYPLLKKGDHIRILCTARSVEAKDLNLATQWVESLGYQVSLGNTIGKQHHQYGGSNKERLEDFMDALKDDSVNAIWIARGGYGTVKIVDSIDMDVLKGSNKLLIGYSDVTHLHGLWQQHGLRSLHTFMPRELEEKADEVKISWKKAVEGSRQEFVIPNHQNLKSETINAPVVGGNLSVLVSMLGSPTFPNVDGHFLFLEDLDELRYHIDRMMTVLKRAGKLAHLKGLIIGGFTDIRDHETPFGKTVEEIINEHTTDYDYPVIYNFPAGHVVDNYSFVLGKQTNVIIETDKIFISQ